MLDEDDRGEDVPAGQCDGHDDVVPVPERLGQLADADLAVVAGRDERQQPQLLDLARRNAREAGATNVEFLRGRIEDIPLPDGSVDVVVDLVGGPRWPQLLEVLRRGGRYAVAGAIGGPIAEIDLRTLYLRDLSLFGCTFQEDEVFENLIGYVERGEIRPVVSRTYPLGEIAQAQEAFLTKGHTGKLVLIPPGPDA